MSTLPIVALVGRMNVGKSTLFNRLSSGAKSITYDREGVTRDAIKDVVEWNGVSFQVVDTGGISVRKVTDPILERVRTVALKMVEQAELVLFLVDAHAGLLEQDRELAKHLRKQNKNVVLVINKMDGTLAKERQYEFDRLGFEQTIPLSAQHGTGMADLLEVITQSLPVRSVEEMQEQPCQVVILGKPNVGKSSLMNHLVNYERSIVADMPGTTREAISERISFYKEDIELIDTPGLRKKRAIEDELEELMVKSSLRALKNADIALLVIDSSAGTISDQELKLAFYAFEHFKGLIILYNKSDLAHEDTHITLESTQEIYEYFLKKIPALHISCKTGKNVGKVVPLVDEVWKRYTQQIPDDELTMILKEAITRTPLYHKSSLLILRRAEQLSTRPITIRLWVNEPLWFGQSQLSFFENVLRKKIDLKGVPVKFVTRKKS